MLFLTNRAFNEGNQTVKNRSVSFDLDNNSPNNSVFFCKRTGDEQYIELGHDVFINESRKSKAPHVLLYIHGYSNLPEKHIFPTVQALQKHFDQRKKGFIDVIPIIWPCDNDFGIVKDYWDDQKSSDMSAYSFARALCKFMSWSERSSLKEVCVKRIHLLSHSMGSRVLKESLRVWEHYDLPAGVPQLFRNSFLVAADLVNDTLEFGKPGQVISDASRNVVVYHANDDLALRASKVMNIKNKIASKRLGHTGPISMNKTPTNVYSIDCDNINNLYDSPMGHTYFLNRDGTNKPGVVFDHIFETIDAGRVFPSDSKIRDIILSE